MEPRCICFPLSSQEALWDALKSRDIDLVISDHSPCTEDLKLMDRGDFMAAWGGISGVQYGECLLSICARTYCSMDKTTTVNSNFLFQGYPFSGRRRVTEVSLFTMSLV